MSQLGRWLEDRLRTAPAELAEDLSAQVRHLEQVEMPGSSLGHEPSAARASAPVDELARMARARLERARLSPGRVRESAFHLLAADALITYACEAALQTRDPESALGGLTAPGE